MLVPWWPLFVPTSALKGKNIKLKSIKLAIFKAISIAVVVVTEIWY